MPGLTALQCAESGGTPTEYDGVPACAYPSTRGATSYFALGSGLPLATIEVSGAHRGEMPTTNPLLVVAGLAMALMIFGRK